MGDISKGEGRTILFVSHNMGSIKQLCNKGVLLSNGQNAYSGSAEATIKRYMANSTVIKSGFSAIGSLKDAIKIVEVKINNIPIDVAIMPKQEIVISVKYQCMQYLPAFRVSFAIFNDGNRIITLQDLKECRPIEPGLYISDIKIPSYFLRPGSYSLSVGGHNTNHSDYSIGNTEWLFAVDVSSFEVLEDWSERYDFNNLGFVNLPEAMGTRANA